MRYSIIIPTYNQADLLHKALKSIVFQTYYDFEIIVVNNFSNDHTLEVVSMFDKLNIKLFNFRNNGIIASSRNYGARNASGEFLCFLDSDDEWYPEKLFHINAFLQKENCDMVVHAEHWLYQNGKKSLKIYGPEKFFHPKYLIYNRNCISTSAVTISRKLFNSIGGFNEKAEFILAEDYELWIRLSIAKVICKFITTPLGLYRVHNEGNSRKLMLHLKSQLKVLKTHKSSIQVSYLKAKYYYYKRVSRILIGIFLRYLRLR